ncbi:MAG: beta-lactamase family protein [Lachnospiraceae bacterium]|nr:beta-lactamase family protein [Lachnospiraceae bacterium]
MDFDGFIKDITDKQWQVYGVEVYENGELIHSFGDTKEHIYDIYSATKSILSIAFGIAYDRGQIGIADPLTELLPKEYIDRMSSAKKEQWKAITMERLLTMSVADLPFRPEGDDYLKYSLSCDIADPGCKEFNYSNISAYLTGVALTQALGCDLSEFIKHEILEPLGIKRYELGRSPEGYFYGASKMKMSVNGLSRIGLLLANKGEFEGKKILSEEYVRNATSIKQMNREGGYGYFIWKYRNGFSINGKWKQKCYVLPDEGLIVTYLSHIEDDSNDLLYSMEKHILGISK